MEIEDCCQEVEGSSHGAHVVILAESTYGSRKRTIIGMRRALHITLTGWGSSHDDVTKMRIFSNEG